MKMEGLIGLLDGLLEICKVKWEVPSVLTSLANSLVAAWQAERVDG
jgi:hypothetical protein